MDIRDYCLSILAAHNCDKSCYSGFDISIIVSDLESVYPDGMEYGFTYWDVARELQRIGASVPVYPKSATGNWNDIYDWGSWGFIEPDLLYDRPREYLAACLASGEDFNTGWHGCKKELFSMEVVGFGDMLDICVSGFMDDVPDIIYDCDHSDFLNDEEINKVEQLLNADDEFRTELEDSTHLPRTSRLEEVLSAAGKIVNEIDEALKDYFRTVQSIVDYVIEQRENEQGAI